MGQRLGLSLWVDDHKCVELYEHWGGFPESALDTLINVDDIAKGMLEDNKIISVEDYLASYIKAMLKVSGCKLSFDLSILLENNKNKYEIAYYMKAPNRTSEKYISKRKNHILKNKAIKELQNQNKFPILDYIDNMHSFAKKHKIPLSRSGQNVYLTAQEGLSWIEDPYEIHLDTKNNKICYYISDAICEMTTDQQEDCKNLKLSDAISSRILTDIISEQYVSIDAVNFLYDKICNNRGMYAKFKNQNTGEIMYICSWG